MPKISSLQQDTAPTTTDYIVTVDTETSATKKVLFSDMLTGLFGSTKVWTETGRTTLGLAGNTISVTPLVAKKYMAVCISVINTGGAIGTQVRFNNDSASNYSYRTSGNGGADSASTSTTFMQVTGNATCPQFAILEGVNITAQEKLFFAAVVESSTAGAATAPDRRTFAGKWANTSAQITRIDVINPGAGNFAIGSEVVVFGHD